MGRPKRGWPPARDGVSPSCVALPPGPWRTLLAFMSQRFAMIGEAEWRQRFESGLVIGEHGQAVGPDAPYLPHGKLYYFRHWAKEPSVPFEEAVVHQDEHLVVADKPHFLPVTPGGRYVQQTLLVRLKRKLGIDTLSPLHRLDLETAGLVAFSVNPAERDRYHALFRERRVRKLYEAIAPHRPDLDFPRTMRSRMEEREHAFMQMHEVPGEPNAFTEVDLAEVRGGVGLYRLAPLTGRKHQLRLHMASLGLPIVGDRIYPVLLPPPARDAEPSYAEPLRLLARVLAFTCPVTGRELRFESRRALDWPQGLSRMCGQVMP